MSTESYSAINEKALRLQLMLGIAIPKVPYKAGKHNPDFTSSFRNEGLAILNVVSDMISLGKVPSLEEMLELRRKIEERANVFPSIALLAIDPENLRLNVESLNKPKKADGATFKCSELSRVAHWSRKNQLAKDRNHGQDKVYRGPGRHSSSTPNVTVFHAKH